MQKAKEAGSQPRHRLKFNRIELRATLMQGKPEVSTTTGFTGLNRLWLFSRLAVWC
jgi:hypothetical protein